MKGSFHWPVTEPGQTVALACPYGSATTLEAKLSTKSPNYVHVTDTESRQQLYNVDKDGSYLAVRSCERYADGTVSWANSDLSVCREQRLAVAEERSALVENLTVGRNLTSVEVGQVAEEVVNLVDDALVDPKVQYSTSFFYNFIIEI